MPLDYCSVEIHFNHYPKHLLTELVLNRSCVYVWA